MENHSSVANYLLQLDDKGFKFSDDMIAFIYFGQRSTDASDHLVMAAIEITLKAQKEFDGSFYLSLLERLKEKKITSRKVALQFAKEVNVLDI
ncbi:DUF6123 family protein [Bacillus sp. FJAT-52991]|uniref:DUF6123 family protein n=1 Tax=Bacillus kandeliae TaxID=3129297 RepID=A0ABZ2N214_9BACI